MKSCYFTYQAVKRHFIFPFVYSSKKNCFLRKIERNEKLAEKKLK